jgi:hypothetical protein
MGILQCLLAAVVIHSFGAPSGGIRFEGNPIHEARFKAWLTEMAAMESGRKLVDDILRTGHSVVVTHNPTACEYGGRTRHEMSSASMDGRGVDVEILLDMNMPDTGTQFVSDRDGGWVEFTAVQVIFHELVHARFAVQGKAQYNDEGAAIMAENEFRREQYAARGVADAPQRYGIEDSQRRVPFCPCPPIPGTENESGKW